jgi:hypothetical protein
MNNKYLLIGAALAALAPRAAYAIKYSYMAQTAVGHQLKRERIFEKGERVIVFQRLTTNPYLGNNKACINTVEGDFCWWVHADAVTDNPASNISKSDADIARQIVQESREAYYRTGHPCACPDDTARDGSSCGRRSAYSRPGGAEPLCYPSDVTAGMILDYKNQHKSEQ